MTQQTIGTAEPEKAFAQTTSGESVTMQSIVTDQGVDKEVVTLDPVAGARSEAPASSGIPSALAQHGAAEESARRSASGSLSDPQPADPAARA